MNKKILKRTAVLSATAMIAAATVLGAAGCGNKTERRAYDNTKDTIVFSSQDFDKVFNPFYSTSAMDANAVGLTQISMLSNDKDGNPVWGDDEAVVTKDFETITKGVPNVNQTTEYYFVLKNNVQFSNGSYLTMKDVLFNMYVYLDPAYTGSSTMYSTDIVGLKEYRTQESSEKEQESFESNFTDAADDRIDALTLAIQEVKDTHKEATMTSEQMITYLGELSGSAYANVVDDYKRAERLFKEELQNDFNANKDTYADIVFKDAQGKIYKNLFTTDVETFLYNEGYISWDKNDGQLTSTFENDMSKLKEYTEQQAIDLVFNANCPLNMDFVINYWATATNLAVEIAGDAREKYFETNPQTYPNIRGIQFINKASPFTVNGVEYGVPEYNPDGSVKSGNEVLKITINDIDPKAVWNFSFGVAPMYYYSNEEQINLFDYESHFGVEFGSQSFQTQVIKNPNKIGVPVGAGPYMASDASGHTEGIGSGDFLANNVMYFHSNPYYVMGEPLITHLHYQVVSTNQIMNSLQTGEIDFGEPNAKQEIINQLKGLAGKGLKGENVQTAGYGYVGVNASKVPSIYVRRAIMHSIDTSLSVKYYNGTAKPIYRSMSLSSWAYPDGALAYYPYIGDKIPEDLTKVYPDYADYVTNVLGLKSGDTMTKEQQIGYIKYLVEDLGGYTIGSNGLYKNGNSTLKYTFTIAGQETDHPAYDALYQAGEFLTNEVGGFQILTKTDNNALTKLGTGALTVWAAAWGSTIDPDMYQVYHMDSKATSVLNWGYQSILNNAGGKYDTELQLVTDLSEIIENARKSNDNSKGGARAILYKQALDLVMELAVELPMYQRDDLFAYNFFKIDENTFTPASQRSAFKGLTSDIHKLSLVTNLEK